MRVWTVAQHIKNAISRFSEQIRDELNVKTVSEIRERPLHRVVKLKKKTAGPKLGPQLPTAERWLAEASQEKLEDACERIEAIRGFNVPGTAVPLLDEDFDISWKAPEGWSGVADRGTQVLIDTRITEGLAREGMAREVVRHVQNTRKEADLQPEDRIVLWLHTDAAELRQAIAAHRDYIAAETLTVQWSSGSLNGQGHGTDVKVDGQPLRIELSKAPAASVAPHEWGADTEKPHK
jgi:isoleucyl-tRNA synthetase